MFRVHLCNPQNNWNKLQIINLKKGDIIDGKVQINLNKWHQLKIIFTAEFARYDQVKTTNDWGVRIETDDLDLGFVLFSKKELSDNTIECNLMSPVYRLYTSELNNADRYIDGSLATFLNELEPSFTWTAIGSDVDIKLQTGILDNFEIAKKAIQYKDFFSFVDGGLKDTGGGNYQPEILYGNFSKDILSYYNSTLDQRFKPLQITNRVRIDNHDTEIAYIEDYAYTQQSEQFTLLYPYADTGQGASPNTRVELRNPFASYIDPQFPLVARTSPITGETRYYIRNPYAINYVERVRVYSPTESNNSLDDSGSENVNNEISEEILYSRATSYIQAYAGQQGLNISPTLKKVVLAGILARVDFVETKKKNDKSKIKTKIKEDFILDNLEFDFSEYA